jgi:hypothetical protein
LNDEKNKSLCQYTVPPAAPPQTPEDKTRYYRINFVWTRLIPVDYYYKMRKIGLFFGFLLILNAVIFSQDISGSPESPQAGGGESIFVPFVSRIQGEIKNHLLRLSWIDSPSVRGPVFIYRSTVPFEEISPASRSRPVEVPYGAKSYIDELEGPGTFYYFVAASDEWGQKYEILIPFGNSISIQVSEQGAVIGVPQVPAQPQTPGQLPAPVRSQVPEPAEEPAIRNIKASVEGDKVIISFSGGAGKRPILYRSIRPFKEARDLLSAVIVQPGVSSPFIDYPVPGIPYYYALVPEADITGGTLAITPGINATTQSVEVSTGQRIGLPPSSPGLRSLPLPQISLQAATPGMNAFSETPPPRAGLSPEAAKVLRDIPPAGERARPLKKPRAFNQDLELPAGGEEHVLRSIIQGPFSKKEWETARDELIGYLALPRSSFSEARARFYLGQCYYFTGAYRESLFEFLSVQSDYPTEAAGWIQSVLLLLSGS